VDFAGLDEWTVAWSSGVRDYHRRTLRFGKTIAQPLAPEVDVLLALNEAPVDKDVHRQIFDVVLWLHKAHDRMLKAVYDDMLKPDYPEYVFGAECLEPASLLSIELRQPRVVMFGCKFRRPFGHAPCLTSQLFDVLTFRPGRVEHDERKP
jgi:hypothetical protein